MYETREICSAIWHRYNPKDKFVPKKDKDGNVVKVPKRERLV